MFLYSTASRHINNNPSLVFLEFSNSYIIGMTLITRKRFILETFSYTAVIVQEMTELFTFCDKSIKLCMISTRHVKNISAMDPAYFFLWTPDLRMS